MDMIAWVSEAEFCRLTHFKIAESTSNPIFQSQNKETTPKDILLETNVCFQYSNRWSMLVTVKQPHPWCITQQFKQFTWLDEAVSSIAAIDVTTADCTEHRTRTSTFLMVHGSHLPQNQMQVVDLHLMSWIGPLHNNSKQKTKQHKERTKLYGTT
jgi:hypothetical protein